MNVYWDLCTGSPEATSWTRLGTTPMGRGETVYMGQRDKNYMCGRRGHVIIDQSCIHQKELFLSTSTLRNNRGAWDFFSQDVSIYGEKFQAGQTPTINIPYAWLIAQKREPCGHLVNIGKEVKSSVSSHSLVNWCLVNCQKSLGFLIVSGVQSTQLQCQMLNHECT